MRLSEDGARLIQSFEGLRLKIYLDAVGVPTGGWGHTKGLTQADVGRDITRAQAEAWFMQDVREFEKGVNRLVLVPLSQNQFDALVSFAFNVGLDEDADDIAEGLGDSTLLERLNSGNYAGAAAELPKWRFAGGKSLRGLERRRAAEMALFMEAVPAEPLRQVAEREPLPQARFITPPPRKAA